MPAQFKRRSAAVQKRMAVVRLCCGCGALLGLWLALVSSGATGGLAQAAPLPVPGPRAAAVASPLGPWLDTAASHPGACAVTAILLLLLLRRLTAKPGYQYPRAPFARARQAPEGTKSIAVIGSGPAGSAFTLCSELWGIPVTVYDRLPSLKRDESSYINFKNVGLMALGEVSPELERSLRDNPTNLSPFTPIKTAAGEVMVTINDPSAILLRRNELSMIISSQCKTKVQYGREVLKVTDATDGGVLVHFTDGTTESHSMAVMCCGSRIRKVETPGLNIQPKFYKKWVLRRVRDPSVADMMPRHEQLYFGNAGQLIFTFPGEYLLISRDGQSLAEIPQENLVQEFKDFTGQVGGDYKGNVVDLIAKTEYHREKQYISWRSPPPKKWYAGRVVAIGDACHPMTPATGSGASMAVLDGIELAVQLSKVDWWKKADLEAVLKTYQEMRETQIKSLWKIDSLRNSMNDMTNPLGIFFRDMVYGLVFKITTTLAKRRTLR